MPELPEVETITRDLSKIILYDTITEVQILDSCNIKKINPDNFFVILSNQQIRKISRKGKMIIWELSKNYYLLFHLKMTGAFEFFSSGQNFPRYSKIIFHFKKAEFLSFLDIRKFAVIYLLNRENFKAVPYLQNLGIDPTSSGFTLSYLQSLISKYSQKNIKNLILDQHLIAGLGNIYAQEVLFKARINPLLRAKNLSAKQISQLHFAIRQVLTQAIQLRGTTFRDYQDALGKKGSYQTKLFVYQKFNQPCLICGTKLQKITQNNRATTYCPFCQQ